MPVPETAPETTSAERIAWGHLQHRLRFRSQQLLGLRSQMVKMIGEMDEILAGEQEDAAYAKVRAE